MQRLKIKSNISEEYGNKMLLIADVFLLKTFWNSTLILK